MYGNVGRDSWRRDKTDDGRRDADGPRLFYASRFVSFSFLSFFFFLFFFGCCDRFTFLFRFSLPLAFAGASYFRSLSLSLSLSLSFILSLFLFRLDFLFRLHSIEAPQPAARNAPPPLRHLVTKNLKRYKKKKNKNFYHTPLKKNRWQTFPNELGFDETR